MVVNLKLREDVLLEKCLGRRICGQCGKNFNIASINVKGENGNPGMSMPPLLPPTHCMTKLITRADDTEAVVKERLRVYYEKVTCSFLSLWIADINIQRMKKKHFQKSGIAIYTSNFTFHFPWCSSFDRIPLNSWFLVYLFYLFVCGIRVNLLRSSTAVEGNCWNSTYQVVLQSLGQSYCKFLTLMILRRNYLQQRKL